MANDLDGFRGNGAMGQQAQDFGAENLALNTDAQLDQGGANVPANGNGAAPDNVQLVAQAAPPATPPATDVQTVVVQADANGNVHLPDGTDLGTPKVVGNDLEFVQADGHVVIIPNGAVTHLTVYVGNVEVPQPTLVALLQANGIQPAEGPGAAAPGNDGAHPNFTDATPGGIGDGIGYSDLLDPNGINIASQFSSRILNTALIADPTISFGGGGITFPDQNGDGSPDLQHGLTLVDEAALDGSSAQAAGTDPGSDAETTQGTFVITSFDGKVGALTVDGIDVTNPGPNGIVVHGGHGDLTVFFDGTNYSWTYTLTSNVAHPDPTAHGAADEQRGDDFTIQVTDTQGRSSTPADLSIDVLDDAPVIHFGAPETTDGGLANFTATLDETVGSDRYNSAAGENGGSDVNSNNDDAPGVLGQVITNIGGEGGGLASLFAGQIDFGADGPSGQNSVVTSFSFSGFPAEGGLATNLMTTNGQEQVTLFLVNGEIVGRDADGNEVLSIAIVADPNHAGQFQLETTLYQALYNSEDNNQFDSTQVLKLLGDDDSNPTVGLVLTVTATDGDGDSTTQVSDPVTIISTQGSGFAFQDDGPVLLSVTSHDGDATGGNFFFDGFTTNGNHWGEGSGVDATGVSGDWKISFADGSDGAPQLERVGDGYLGMHSSTGGTMIDLDASPGNVEISQVLNLAEGQTYTLSFEAGAAPEGSKHLVVMFGGEPIFDIDPTGPMHTYTFTITGGADAAANLLEFKDTGSADSFGTFLANVQVTNYLDDEDTSAAGNQGGPGDDGNGAVATGKINFDAGSDGLGQIAVTSVHATSNDNPIDLKVMYVNGTGQGTAEALHEGVWIADGHGGGTMSWSSDHVQNAIVVTVGADGSYSVALNAALDHPVSGTEDNLDLGFGFTITDGDGDHVSGTIGVNVDDDTPQLTGIKPVQTTVDEDDLNTRNPSDLVNPGALGTSPNDGNGDGSFTGSNGEAHASGALTGLVDFGADGRGSFSFVESATSALDELGLSSHGAQLSYEIQDGVLYGYVEADKSGGYDQGGDRLVFKLTLGADGKYDFSLYDSVDHTSGNSANTALQGSQEGGLNSIDFGSVIQATDGDGDSINLGGQFSVAIRDDVPTADFSGTSVVTENGTAQGAFIDQYAYGTLKFEAGADGAHITGIDYRFGNDGTIMRMGEGGGEANTFPQLTSGGHQVTVTTSADGLTVTGVANGVTVFTLQVTDAATGAYTFTQFAPIDHPDHNQGGADDALRMVFDFTVTDGDGDTSTNAVQVDIRDDVPVAEGSGTIVVTEDGTPQGVFIEQHADGTLLFDAGADGAQVTNITYRFGNSILEMAEGNSDPQSFPALTSGGHQVTVTTSADGLTVTGVANGVTVFTLQVTDAATGAYTFTQFAPIDHPDHNQGGADDALRMVFDFTVTDGDGDTSTSWVQVDVRDDVPTASYSGTAVVTEDGTPEGVFIDQHADGTLVFDAGADGARVTNISYRFGNSILEMAEGNSDPQSFPALTSGGHQITVTTSADGLTVTGVTDDGTKVFTLEVTDAATGAYTFTQFAPIDHPDHGQAGADDALRMVFDFTVTDGDGDTASNAVQVDIRDDMPVIHYGIPDTADGLANFTATVDETIGGDRYNTVIGENGTNDADPNTDDAAGVLGRVVTQIHSDDGGLAGLFNGQIDFGADGPSSQDSLVTSFSFTGFPEQGGLATNLVTTNGQEQVSLYLENGVIVGRDADGDEVLSIAVVADPNHAGQFQLETTLYQALYNTDDNQFDATQILKLAGGSDGANIGLVLTTTATDGDGDSTTQVSDPITIISNEGSGFAFQDDGPVLLSVTANQTDLTGGNFFFDGFTPNGNAWGAGSGIDATGMSGDWKISYADGSDGAPQLERVGDGYLGMHSSTGGFMIDLDASPGNVEISQTLGLAEGQTYTLSFEAGAAPKGSEHLVVMFGGEIVLDIDPQGPMQTYTLTLPAGAGNGSNLLEFKETGTADSYGTFLANVKVTQVNDGILDDEDVSARGNQGGAGDDGHGTTATGKINFDAGSDGLGHIAVTGISATSSDTQVDLKVIYVDGTGKGTAEALHQGVWTADGHGGGSMTWSSDHVQNAIVVSVAADGSYSVTLNAALDHPVAGTEDNLNLNIGFDIYDGDGDHVSGTIGVNVDDDTPQLTGVQAVQATVDEDDILTNQSQGTSPDDGNHDGSVTGDPSDHLTGPAVTTGSLGSLVDFGADGRGSFSFVSGATDTLAALGLSSHGGQLSYEVQNGVLYGYVNNGNSESYDQGDRLVLKLTLGADGKYQFDLYDQLDHVSGDGQNTTLQGSQAGGVSAIDFGSLIQATDGDGDSLTLAGQFSVTVRDDVPVAHISAIPFVNVVIDETPGTQFFTSDVSSSDLPGGIQQAFQALGTNAIGYAYGSPLLQLPVVTTVGSQVGADGPGSTVLSLALHGAENGSVNSGLTTTNGDEIDLTINDAGLVVGVVHSNDADNGKVAFALAIDQGGHVAIVQYLALHNPVAGDNNDAVDLSGKVDAVVTVTDDDGDKATDSVGIGDKIVFLDDGPSVSVDVHNGASLGTLTLDESIINAGSDANATADNNGAVTTPSFITTPDASLAIGIVHTPTGPGTTVAGLFKVNHDFGADGGTMVETYSLVLKDGGSGFGNHQGVETTLSVTNLNGHFGSSDTSIYLFTEADGSITGRVGGANGDVALHIVIDPATGQLTIEQYLPIDHTNTSSLDESALLKLVDSNDSLSIKLTATVTDGDHDTATDSSSVAIVGHNSSIVSIQDDGPSITKLSASFSLMVDETSGAQTHGAASDHDARGALSQSGSVDVTGFFQINYGSDGAASTSYALTKADGSSLNGTVVSGLHATADAADAIYLYKVGNTIEAHIGSSTGAKVFDVTIDASGHVQLTQYMAISHADTSNADDAASIANLIYVTAKATDGDGDSASSTSSSALTLTFYDDGPSVVVAGASSDTALTTQDHDTIGHADTTTGDFSGAFTITPSYGADGQGSLVTIYSLSVTGHPDNHGHVDSGLDSEGGQDIYLYKTASGDIVGSTAGSAGSITGGNTIFRVSVDADGQVTLTQYAPIQHHNDHDSSAPYDTQLASLADNLIGLTATTTVTDGDGDKASNSATVDISGNIAFADDGPSLDVTATAESGVFLTTQDHDTIGLGVDFSVSTAEFGGVFSIASSSFGADGPGQGPSLHYALSLNGGQGSDSGLTHDGDKIHLYVDVFGNVVGSTASHGYDVNAFNTVFTVSVDGAGRVTLTQLESIDHASPGDTSTPYDTQLASLGDGKISLTATATITDHDGDSATDSATVDLGGNIRFADDGPRIDVSASGESSVHLDTYDSETIGPNSDTDVSTSRFDGVFSVSANYGADGAGSTSALNYALSLSVPEGTASNLSHDGQAIHLFIDGNGVVRGSTAADEGSVNSSNTVFSISVDGSGKVTLTQFQSIDHPNNNDTHSPYSDQTVSLGSDFVQLTASANITDGDGDKASDSASIDLGGNIRFHDDGPSITLKAGSDANVILTTQDHDTIGHSDTASSTANFGNVFSITSSSYGADGQGTISTAYALSITGQSHQGHVDSGLDSDGHSVYLYKVGGNIVGSTAGDATGISAANTIFTVSVGADGSVTLTQNAPVDHGDHDSSAPYDTDVKSLSGLIDLTATATITDSDGDSATSSQTVHIGDNLHFADDGPTALSATAASLDDEAGSNGIDGGPGDQSGANLGSTGGTLVISAGGDGLAGFQVTGVTVTDSAGHTGNALSVLYVDGQGVAHAEAVTFSWDASTHSYIGTSTHFTGTGGEAAAIVLSIDPSSGAYTLTVNAPLDHPINDNPNGPGASWEDNLTLNFSYQVKDGDGDTANGALTVTVNDDSPTITGMADLTATGAGEVQGNWTADFGADGMNAASAVHIAIGGQTADGLTYTVENVSVGTSASGEDIFKVDVSGNGTSYSFYEYQTYANGVATMHAFSTLDAADGTDTDAGKQYFTLTADAKTGTYDFQLVNNTLVTEGSTHTETVTEQASASFSFGPSKSPGDTTNHNSYDYVVVGHDGGTANGQNNAPADGSYDLLVTATRTTQHLEWVWDGIFSGHFENVSETDPTNVNATGDGAGHGLGIGSDNHGELTSYADNNEHDQLHFAFGTQQSAVTLHLDPDNSHGNEVLTITISDGTHSASKTFTFTGTSLTVDLSDASGWSGQFASLNGHFTSMDVENTASSHVEVKNGHNHTVTDDHAVAITGIDYTHTTSTTVTDPGTTTTGGDQLPFTVGITDGDGDTVNSGLNVTVQPNLPPTLTIAPQNADSNGHNLVHESALPSGSAPYNGGEYTHGTMTVADPNGLSDLASVTIGGTTVNLADLIGSTYNNGNQTIAGAHGTLSIYGFNPVTGALQYDYQLTSAVHDASSNNGADTVPSGDSFSVVVTDAGGANSAASTLAIDIVDDVPHIVSILPTVSTAVLQTQDAETINGPDTATANMVDGVGTTGAPGADGYGGVTAGPTTLAITATPVGGLVSSGLEAHGAAIYLYQLADGTVVGSTATSAPTGIDGSVVFSLASDGGYGVTLTQYAPIDHASGSDLASLGHGLVGMVFNETLADGDGDTVSASSDALDLGGRIQFADDVPHANNDANTVAEDTATAISGNVLDNDQAGADTPKTVEAWQNNAATHGIFVGNSDGSYSYTLDNTDAAVQALNVGQSLVETIGYTMTDADGDQSTATLTITITGTNDAPVASVDANTVVEAGVDDNGASFAGTPEATGNVLGNDHDVDNNSTLTVSAVAGGNVGDPITGTYGSIVIHSDGSYTYTLDNSSAATNALAQGDTVSEQFTYTVSDEHNATDTATITITITGTNDAPAVQGETAAVSEAGVNPGNTAFAGIDQATGNVLDNDSDADHNATLTVTAVGGNSADVGHSIAGTYGSIVIHGDGSYTYTLDNGSAATNALEQDATGIEQFTYSVSDEHGATRTATLTVNVTGTNDAPQISVGGSDSDAATLPETNAGLTANGTLTVTDVDHNDTVTTSVLSVTASGTTTGLGLDDAALKAMLSLAAGNGSQTNWTFNSGNQAFNYLNPGESLTLSYTVEATDSHGATADHTVTITIDGTADNAPLVISGAASAAVDEAALDSSPSTTSTGSFHDLVTGGVDGNLSFGFAALTGHPAVQTTDGNALTSGGHAVLFAMDSNGDLVGYVDNGGTGYQAGTDTKVFSLHVDGSTGAYTFTLNAPIDHPTGNGTNSLAIDLDGMVTVTDHGGPAADTNVALNASITVTDDVPSAAGETAETTEGAKPTVNAILVLDLSQSMSETVPGTGGKTRLALMQEAVHDFLANESVNFTQVTVYTFGVSAALLGSFSTASAADTSISALSQLTAGTNYGTVINLIDGTSANGYAQLSHPAADQTNVYFLSDGDPTGGQSLSSSQQSTWTNFLNNQQVDQVYALGFSDINSTSFLEQIAPRDGDTAEIVSDPNKLSATLNGTLPGSAEGNVLTNDHFGADGGHLQSITVDSHTYTAADVVAGTHHIEVTTNIGGTLVFYFADEGSHKAGDYDYSAPASVNGDKTETFQYVLTDGDGDTASANLTITVHDIPNAPPTLDLHGTEYVLDSFGSVSYANNNGTVNWNGSWTETGETSSSPSNGDITVSSNNDRLQFSTSIDGNESISRAIDLTGATGAILTFNYGASNFSSSDNVTIEAFYNGGWHQVGSTLSSGTNTFQEALPDGASQIRFVTHGSWDNPGSNSDASLWVDDVKVSYTPDAPTTFTSSYTEDGAAAAISHTSLITDADDTSLSKAKIVLTNEQAGDFLALNGTHLNNGASGNLASGIHYTVVEDGNQITVNLSGNYSAAAYQSAIDALTYASTSENPSTTDRVIDVTVTDAHGNDSNTGVAKIHVTAVNDAPTVESLTVISNAGQNAFLVTDDAFLHYATDPDSSSNTFAITAASGTSGLAASHSGSSISLDASDSSDHSFSYTVSDGIDSRSASAIYQQDTNGSIDGTSGDDIIVSASTPTATIGFNHNGYDVGDVVSLTINGTTHSYTVDASHTSAESVYDQLRGLFSLSGMSWEANNLVSDTATLTGAPGAELTVGSAITNVAQSWTYSVDFDNVGSSTNSFDSDDIISIKIGSQTYSSDSSNSGNNSQSRFDDAQNSLASVLTSHGFAVSHSTSSDSFTITTDSSVTVTGSVLVDNSTAQTADVSSTHTSPTDQSAPSVSTSFDGHTLNGGAGNDFLVAGAGQDTMTGGTGADTFVIHPNTLNGSIHDIITDYSFNEGDHVDLSALLNNLPSNTSDLGDHVSVTHTTGNQYSLSVNVAGDGNAANDVHVADITIQSTAAHSLTVVFEEADHQAHQATLTLPS